MAENAENAVLTVIARFGFIATALWLSATAVFADRMADCAQSRSAELKIGACTDIIQSGDMDAGMRALAYRNRANGRLWAGAFEQAIADYSAAIKLNAQNAPAFAGRAQARLGRGDADGAITDYGEALHLAPDTTLFLIGRGHAQLVRENPELAIIDFTRAIALNPKSASAFNHRGLAYRRKGELDRAIADYSAAISINPIYALAFNNRGYVYEAQGKREAAIADFRAALLLDASLVGAKDGLRRLGSQSLFAAESEQLVRDGKAPVEANCARCHAVGGRGESPLRKAPEFRNLQERHALLSLREPLSRGIAAPHDEMPKFALPEADVDRIIAYINTLTPAK
jgi:tetratricopeptide (TPR) repeat protein